MRHWMILAGILLAAVASPAAADFEDELNARWQGSWVILNLEVSSGCDSSYTNNEVVGRRANGKGRVTLRTGEVARVHKLEVKRERVELLLNIDEPLLIPYRDGPFELFEEATCKVELFVPVPREAIKGRNVAAIESALGAWMEQYGGRREAERSASWNRREREPYPKDYEKRLAEHRKWKAAQVNAAVGQRIAQALEEATRATAHANNDAEYGAGLAAGLAEMRWVSHSSCDAWLESSYWTHHKSPPGGASSKFKDGFEDGQRIGYHVLVARNLQGCFLPPA